MAAAMRTSTAQMPNAAAATSFAAPTGLLATC
jgi:hypothetical protein